MTREEALKYHYDNNNEWFVEKIVDDTINEIYDDFESRTCESCKHFVKAGDDSDLNLCRKILSWSSHACDYTIELTVSKDFGCNKHDAKDV